MFVTDLKSLADTLTRCQLYSCSRTVLLAAKRIEAQQKQIEAMEDKMRKAVPLLLEAAGTIEVLRKINQRKGE